FETRKVGGGPPSRNPRNARALGRFDEAVVRVEKGVPIPMVELELVPGGIESGGEGGSAIGERHERLARLKPFVGPYQGREGSVRFTRRLSEGCAGRNQPDQSHHDRAVEGVGTEPGSHESLRGVRCTRSGARGWDGSVLGRRPDHDENPLVQEEDQTPAGGSRPGEAAL